MSKNKTQKIARRSGVAIAALQRNSGGPMRHRLQPKGGAKNSQAEILADYENDYSEWD